MVILEFGKQIAIGAICQQPREGLKWPNLLNSGLISQHLTGRKSELKIPLDGRLFHAANMDLCVHNREGGNNISGISEAACLLFGLSAVSGAP